MVNKNSPLFKSLENSTQPLDNHEQYYIIHCSFTKSLPVLELLEKIEKFKSQGFSNIKFLDSESDYQRVELVKTRSPEEVIEYKLQRIEKTFRHWRNDALRRLKIVILEKELSVVKYEEKINNTEIKMQNMFDKLMKKKSRLNQYKQKLHEIEELINNYENYTYESHLDSIRTLYRI